MSLFHHNFVPEISQQLLDEIKFCTNIHDSQKMNSTDSGYPLTFHLVCSDEVHIYYLHDR